MDREKIVLAERQAGWVAAHQAGRAAAVALSERKLRGRAASEARSVVRAGEDALAELMNSFEPLFSKMVKEHVSGRLGAAWGAVVSDDTMSEARVCALDAIAAYCPTRGTSVSQWVAREVRHHLSALEFDAGGGTRPREWRRVAKVAHVVAEGDAGGRQLSGAELKSAVMEHFVSTTAAGIMEAHPDLSEDEVLRRSRERLSRQSITRAVNSELVELMVTSGGCVSLDAQTVEGGVSLYDTASSSLCAVDHTSLATVVNELLATFDGDDLDDVVSVSGGSVPHDVARRFAARHGVSPADARRELKSATSRLTAPHAQFAAMWPGLETQFEAPAPSTGGFLSSIGAHRSRLVMSET